VSKLKVGFCAAILTAAATAGITYASGDDFHGLILKKPYDSSVHGNGNAPKPVSNQMLYHGGPVMTHSNSVYVIYYGTFPATTEPVIDDFMFGLSGTSALAVNSTYTDMATPTAHAVPNYYTFTKPIGTRIPNSVNGSVYWDDYSQGKQLGNNDIPKIVGNAIGNAGKLPINQDAVYLVVTAPDVKISGFCTSFCAYHTTSTSIASGFHIRYALIPDPTQRCTGCNGGIAVYNDLTTPNGDMGADTMTDDIMHELSETLTDPDINAWYTKSGAENADLCNYIYGTTSTDANGAHYNITFGGKNFLIQLLWANTGVGACSAG
jgi:hypothetical protein